MKGVANLPHSGCYPENNLSPLRLSRDSFIETDGIHKNPSFIKQEKSISSISRLQGPATLNTYPAYVFAEKKNGQD